MAVHVWRKKGECQSLRNEVKLLDSKTLKNQTSEGIGVYTIFDGLLSRFSIEISTIWEPLIKKWK